MADNTVDLQATGSLFTDLSAGTSEFEFNLLLEQYKLYVELADKVSERRQQTNTFFLTANTCILTVLAGFVSLTQEFELSHIWAILPAIAGIVFCISWYRLLHSYAQLNKGKFQIIHKIESRLPTKLFDAEWDILKKGDGTMYLPFTKTERWVPLVFIGLYFVLGIGSIIKNF